MNLNLYFALICSCSTDTKRTNRSRKATLVCFSIHWRSQISQKTSNGTTCSIMKVSHAKMDSTLVRHAHCLCQYVTSSLAWHRLRLTTGCCALELLQLQVIPHTRLAGLHKATEQRQTHSSTGTRVPEYDPRNSGINI